MAGQAATKTLTGEGRSTAELFSTVFTCLHQLKREMEKRRSRDKAGVLLTDSYVALQEIGHRLALMGGEFSGAGRPVELDDDEGEWQELGKRTLSLAEVMAPNEQEDHERSFAEFDLRVHHFRTFLEFLVSGCSQVDEVSRKVIAIVRRVRPELLRSLGLSQVAISRKLNEQRATTSAREKRHVEKLLRGNGTKGFHLLGGTKTESHREKCRQSATGNRNRAEAERRKKAARAE